MTAEVYSFIGGEGWEDAVKKAQNHTLDIDKIKSNFDQGKQ